jgi:hypothetical protein
MAATTRPAIANGHGNQNPDQVSPRARQPAMTATAISSPLRVDSLVETTVFPVPSSGTKSHRAP